MTEMAKFSNSVPYIVSNFRRPTNMTIGHNREDTIDGTLSILLPAFMFVVRLNRV